MTTSKARRKAKVERIECCMKHLESKGFGCCIGKGRTIADDRLFVEVLRNANLVKTKLDAAREGKR